MSRPNPSNLSHKQPSLTPLTNSLMTQNQLVDSLTAHISLYHSYSVSPDSNQNPNPRSSILKWFSSLTVHQRQAHLTIVDHKFTQLLIQMLGKVRTHGHGLFIILPDLPTRDLPTCDLPSLCYKKSRGLLSRTAESNESERSIFELTRLFGSREGEKIEECSCSVNCLDSLTVNEEFVENVDEFVETMDRVSNGGFLRGEENELGSDWVELEWLKARGYYSIGAFVANRLEVALRLAWLNCINCKKRGVKLKEKLIAAGVAANVFWRKKGCVDWWRGLEVETRRNILTVVLGKAARSLINEILKGASCASEDEMWLFRAGTEKPLRYIYAESSRRSILEQSADAEFGSAIMPPSLSGKAASLTTVFNSLFVLQDIVSLILSGLHSRYDMSKVFFSSLGSVGTISDCILRKLRGLVMVISLDYTKLDLLEERNFKSLPKKPKEKLGAGSRRKKGKSHNVKKLNPAPRAGVDESSSEKPLKDLECAVAHTGKAGLMKSNEMPSITIGKEILRGNPSSMVEMEHSQGLVLGKGRNAARKNRKGKNKNKNSSFNNPTEVGNSKSPVAATPCISVITSDEAANFGGVSVNQSVQNVSNDALIGSSTLALNTSLSTTNEPTADDVNARGIEEGHAIGCTGAISPESYQSSNSRIENVTRPLGMETLNCYADCNEIPHAIPVLELDTVSSNEKINFSNEKNETKSDFVINSFGAVDGKDESILIQGQEKRNLQYTRLSGVSECFSYEWPSLAPVYFPNINSHLPPAADRLHLDVGSNWHNHIRQPFVPSVHQARKSPTEGGCNRMLSRPLPMSLDWPPMVRSACGLGPSVACNYDSGFISRWQSAFQQSFTVQNRQFNAKTADDERKYGRDFIDLSEASNAQELTDECESHWISEEELEVHAVSGIDYNQYFGGGVMYWNPSEHPATGFSRPPSLSSDDSSWAWHEADMNRAVDDMVAFSSSYSTNGFTSPTAASFCSPFDPLGPGHQALGYVVSGNEVPSTVLHTSSTTSDAAKEEEVSGSLPILSGDGEGKAGDSLPYPVLRPIVIPNMSSERSRSDFKRSHDHKSPCVPHTRQEQPRIKRPPSPVVLCVPRAPRPPPPSPVSDMRKHRGFPTVRSGSSSPRHWGMRGWYLDGTNSEEACARLDGTEVVWPSWRKKNLSTCPMIQPLPGALLQDRLLAMSQLAHDQEHPDVSFPLQLPEFQNCPTRKASLSLMHSLLHDEIDFFYKQRIWLKSLSLIGLSSKLPGLSKNYGPGPEQTSLVQMQLACPFLQVTWTLWFVSHP